MSASLLPLLPITAEQGPTGLSIGGCSMVELAERFGTPLYVYDEQTLIESAHGVTRAFAGMAARVRFAVKACNIPGVLEIFLRAGLELDVVSSGEIACATRVGFSGTALHFHGNGKSDAELETAADLGMHVVVDNGDELTPLDCFCRGRASPLEVTLRFALPLAVETHPHLDTSGLESKFGVQRESIELERIVRRLSQNEDIVLTGIHSHLGSQIRNETLYAQAAHQLVLLARDLQHRGFPISEVSLGGGWAVQYTLGQTRLPPDRVAASIRSHFSENSDLHPAVEPGRALVARAGVAIYRVCSVKETATRRIIAVDGGMGDNPRPALYGAEYTALPARLRDEEAGTPTSVVGRYCESSDVLVQDVRLPRLVRGDLLCVPVAGAYQLSMSSTYNLVPQPAAVMVDGGESRLLMRRATNDDLMVRHIFPVLGDPTASDAPP